MKIQPPAHYSLRGRIITDILSAKVS